MKTQYTEANGMVTEEVHSQPTLTISHSRKISDNNYGSNDYFVAMQLDVSIDAGEAEKATAIQDGFRLIRQMIDLQHAGTTAAPTPNEARIAEDLGGEVVKEQPKAKTYNKVGADAPKGNAALWQELVDYPTRWFANANKPTPKYPDFKRKGTGEGLWLDKAPSELAAAARQILASQGS